jgi:hypothetical protein
MLNKAPSGAGKLQTEFWRALIPMDLQMFDHYWNKMEAQRREVTIGLFNGNALYSEWDDFSSE